MFDSLTFLNSVGLMALLGVLYGLVQRTTYHLNLRLSVLGVLFGLGAVVAMLDPITVSPGVIVDGRTLFVGFSGAFLGPLGLFFTEAIAIGMRVHVGGTGVVPGIIGMVLAGGAGLLWRHLMQSRDRLRIFCLVMLGIMISVSMVTIAMLPRDVMIMALTSIVPYLLLFNIVGSIVLGGFLERERRKALLERQLRLEAETDALTGLLNRRSFQRVYARLRESGSRKGTALLMADVDHFKKINDVHGHDAGDEVLRNVARALSEAVRSRDCVARMGGEEFVVLLPEATRGEAEIVAERLRSNVKRVLAEAGHEPVNVTISIGGDWAKDTRDLDEAMKRADLALYSAKNSGRDRAVFGVPPGLAA